MLGVLSLAAFMASLDLFIVNVAFRDIGRSFPGHRIGDLSWVLNAYAIVYAALLIPLGRRADRHGRRSMFLFGLVLLTTASLLCAVAPTLWTLVTARVLQAVGAAALTPASLGLLVAVFDGPDRARAVRIWAATGAIAAASGPVIGGLLVELSWRWVFLVNVPVGISALLVAMRVVPDSRERTAAGTPDLAATALIVLGIGALSLALIKADAWGWTSPSTLSGFAVATVAALMLIPRTARHPRPLVEPAILRIASFRWSTIAAVGFGGAFAGFLLTGVLFLQEIWRYGPITVGLCVAPGPLMVPVFAAVASRLRRRLPAGTIIAAGCTTFAAGALVAIASLTTEPSYPTRFLPGLLLTGVGTGLALPEILATATSDLPADRTTTGSAVVNAARQIGSVIGVSIVVSLLSTATTTDPLQAVKHAFWACAALAIAGAISGAALRRHEHPTDPAASLRRTRRPPTPMARHLRAQRTNDGADAPHHERASST